MGNIITCTQRIKEIKESMNKNEGKSQNKQKNISSQISNFLKAVILEGSPDSPKIMNSTYEKIQDEPIGESQYPVYAVKKTENGGKPLPNDRKRQESEGESGSGSSDE